MQLLESFSPEQLGILAGVTGVLLSEGLTLEEVNALGNFITAVGTVMTTFAAQGALLQAQKTQDAQGQALSQQVEALRKQVDILLRR